MGFFKKLFGGSGVENGVPGTAQVVSCSSNRGRGVYQSCHMQLVVQAKGVPATAVEIDRLVHRSKWPAPGMVVPVSVDPNNPTNVEIEWGKIRTSRERGQQTAEQIAAGMRGEGGQPGATPGMFGGANLQVVNMSGRDLSQLPEEKKAKLRMLGIDPDALAAQQQPIGGAAPAPQPPPDDDDMDDRIEQLERLTALRDSGALTAEEFETQKREILEA